MKGFGMKFFVKLMAFLCLASVAKADVLWSLTDIVILGSGAVAPEKAVKSDVSPTEAGAGLAAAGALSVGGIAGYNMAMIRYQANEVLNTAAMLAIVAMSADGGQGKNMTLAESELPNEICNIDMEADKNGNVKITFGSDCKTKKGEAVHMKAVQNMLQEVAGDRASCADNECFIKGL